MVLSEHRDCSAHWFTSAALNMPDPPLAHRIGVMVLRVNTTTEGVHYPVGCSVPIGIFELMERVSQSRPSLVSELYLTPKVTHNADHLKQMFFFSTITENIIFTKSSFDFINHRIC